MERRARKGIGEKDAKRDWRRTRKGIGEKVAKRQGREGRERHWREGQEKALERRKRIEIGEKDWDLGEKEGNRDLVQELRRDWR